MKITLCISVPNDGEKLIALAARTALRLASGKHDIDIHYTCHGDEQRKKIATEDLPLPVRVIHIIEREQNTYPHANSVTHSRCINALYQRADSDIAVICDYDGAFSARHWDETLVDLLINKDIAFFGSPYSKTMAHPATIGNAKIYGVKYQQKPNCIFLAYQPARIKLLSKDLCTFSRHFGTPNSHAIKLVSNQKESRIYGIPVGAFVSLDAGSLVPELIEIYQLPYFSMERRTGTYTVLNQANSIKDPQDRKESTVLPEEYLLNNQPFFVHYRKGTRKNENVQYQVGYTPEQFIQDVDTHTQRILSRPAE